MNTIPPRVIITPEDDGFKWRVAVSSVVASGNTATYEAAAIAAGEELQTALRQCQERIAALSEVRS